MSLFEDLPALSPVQFFGLTADCQFIRGAIKLEKGYILPSTNDLLDEESFADVYAAWNFEHLSFYFAVHRPFQKVGEPDFRKGDSIEIFIDTRDLKTKGVVTRFCHHFVFFSVEVKNFLGQEITRFRNEDTHRLCHPEDLQVTTDLDDKSYRVAVEIPAHCLHGYDPLSFSRIGFTYRINRFDAPSQHFAVSSEEYNIEQPQVGRLDFLCRERFEEFSHLWRCAECLPTGYEPSYENIVRMRKAPNAQKFSNK